jgi:hypothetical protein
MPRRLQRHRDGQEADDPDGRHPGRLAEGVRQGRADDEGVGGDDQDDGGQVGEGDGEGHAVVHGPLHVEPDGGRRREHPVQLAEEAPGHQGQEPGDEDGDPGGVPAT